MNCVNYSPIGRINSIQIDTHISITSFKISLKTCICRTVSLYFKGYDKQNKRSIGVGNQQRSDPV